MNIYYINDDEEPKEDSNNPTKETVEKAPEYPQQPPTPEHPKNNNKKIIIALLIGLIIGVIGFFSYKHLQNDNIPEVVVVDSCIATTNSDIYEYYKNSVVMIKHRYGIQVRINGGEPIVFEEYYVPNFEFYATGFFIDDKGKIVTNRHVVQPSYPYPDEMQTVFKNLKIKIASNLAKDTDPSDYKEKIYQILRGEIIDQDTHESSDLDSLDLDNIEPTIVEYFTNADIDVEPVSLELQVMPHDGDQWIDCKILKTAEDYAIDLAIIENVNKVSSTRLSNIPTIDKAMINDTTIRPGTKAIMIGFPMGMNLANTNDGKIKVQMYEGDINKESDGIKFQYSIPATQGASGAPVFNSCGHLIAVNFSGYDQQGFNFGIVAKHVYELLNK